jgi:hypothetical protein
VEREIFQLRSRRFDRAKRLQTVQHVIAAILLITTANGHLSDPKHHDLALPLLEIAAGAALIVAAIVDKIRKTHARVGWLELAGSAMTYVEAFAKLKEPHHLSFHILTFIAPTVLLLFGLFDARIRSGMRFEANDDAFVARMRVIRWHRVPWKTIESFRITPTHLELQRAGGRAKRLKLKDLYDREAAAAWLADQFTRRGVPAASQSAK